MFDKRSYDVQLQVTHRRDFQIWAALLETRVTTPVRTAGEIRHPRPANHDRLLATAIISALGGLTKHKYQSLLKRAQEMGHPQPRLLLQASQDFADRLRGWLLNGEPFELPEGMRRMLKNLLSGFDADIQGVDAPATNLTSQALLAFAKRSLMPEQFFAGKRFDWYRPSVTSSLGAMSAEDLLAPLTPDLIAKEEQTANAI